MAQQADQQPIEGQAAAPAKSFTITLPSFNFTKMNPDALITFLASLITAGIPVAAHFYPGLADQLPQIADFCNTLSKDLAILGAALHLDGK